MPDSIGVKFASLYAEREASREAAAEQERRQAESMIASQRQADQDHAESAMSTLSVISQHLNDLSRHSDGQQFLSRLVGKATGFSIYSHEFYKWFETGGSDPDDGSPLRGREKDEALTLLANFSAGEFKAVILRHWWTLESYQSYQRHTEDCKAPRSEFLIAIQRFEDSDLLLRALLKIWEKQRPINERDFHLDGRLRD